MGSRNLKVISVGANVELLWLRDAVLQTAGFEVLTSSSETEALNFIARGDCGVLLVCYSLSFAVRQRLAKAFRQHCPEKRIVAITNQPLEKPDFADGFVYGVEGPEVLIDTIRNNKN
jgi:hypothetical protein